MEFPRNVKYESLVDYLKNIPSDVRVQIEAIKQHGLSLAEREDVLWRQLLASFSTMGNSRGYAGLMENQARLDAVSYEELKKLSARERLKRLEMILGEAKIRMHKKKARWLDKNFVAIEELSGLKLATKKFRELPNWESKCEFLMEFEGIGEKYARNICMDLYDPHFRHTIAVDERIKGITEELGYSFTKYQEFENFYQQMAADAGIEPWELDRILYNNRKKISEILSQVGN